MMFHQNKNISYFNTQMLKKTFTMELETVKQQSRRNSGRLPHRNVLQNKPGPRNTDRDNPLESFSLFNHDTLLDSVVQFSLFNHDTLLVSVVQFSIFNHDTLLDSVVQFSLFNHDTLLDSVVQFSLFNHDTLLVSVVQFSLFNHDTLLESVVQFTNQDIDTFHRKIPFVRDDPTRMAYCDIVDIIEKKTLEDRDKKLLFMFIRKMVTSSLSPTLTRENRME